MQARSALFDVYGDHLRTRGSAAPIAALVRLLAPLDITAPAVRTAVSRMVRQGWLAPLRLPGGPGYELTARAVRRLDDAATRIYRTGGAAAGWDGYWHLLVIAQPANRSARERLAADLAFLGYGRLTPGTWLAARPSPEALAIASGQGTAADAFTAVHAADPRPMIDRAWDLEGLAVAYTRFVDELGPVVAAIGPASTDEDAFAARSRLVHAWRNFLFTDPGLPGELLPPEWPGIRAAGFFDTEAGRLLPAAGRYVDACLNGGAERPA